MSTVMLHCKLSTLLQTVVLSYFDGPAPSSPGSRSGPRCCPPARSPPLTDEIGTRPQLEPQINSLEKCTIN